MTTVIAGNAIGATVFGTFVSSLVNDSDMLVSIIIGLVTGLFVFAYDLAHLEEAEKDETSFFKIATELVLGVILSIAVVMLTIFLARHVVGTYIGIPPVGYIAPAMLAGIYKRVILDTLGEVLKTSSQGFMDTIKEKFKKGKK